MADKFNIAISFEDGPDTHKMSKFSEEDVDRLLTVIPGTKLAQGKEVLRAMDVRESATEKLKKIISAWRMIASEEKEERKLGSDKDREAWVASQIEVQEAKQAEIDAILQVKLEEYKYQYLDDLFISARKQATKYEKALDAEMQSAKYTK